MRVCKGNRFWNDATNATVVSAFAGKYPFRISVFASGNLTLPREVVYQGKPSVAAFARIKRIMRLHPQRDYRIRVMIPTGMLMGGTIEPLMGSVAWGTSLRFGQSLAVTNQFGTFQPFLEDYVPYRYNKRSALVRKQMLTTRAGVRQVRRIMNNPPMGGNR